VEKRKINDGRRMVATVQGRAKPCLLMRLQVRLGISVGAYRFLQGKKKSLLPLWQQGGNLNIGFADVMS